MGAKPALVERAPVGAWGLICGGTIRCPLWTGGAGVNVSRPHLRITVETLLRQGRGQREIERLIGVDRKTIRRIAREGQEQSGAKSPGVATGSDSEGGPLGLRGAPRLDPGSPTASRHTPRSRWPTERLVESDLGRQLIKPIERPGVLGDPAKSDRRR